MQVLEALGGFFLLTALIGFVTVYALNRLAKSKGIQISKVWVAYLAMSLFTLGGIGAIGVRLHRFGLTAFSFAAAILMIYPAIRLALRQRN